MREIKFRGWNQVAKCFSWIESMTLWGLTQNVAPLIIEQFTGLKDKNGNGKEIYEGDILSIDGQVGQVFWDQFSCGFRWGRGIDSNIEQTVYLNSFATSFYEVIGNVHENPELINPVASPN